MAQLKCELCGGTELIKENDLFVCQSCGAKYSPEEARRLLGGDGAASQPAEGGNPIVELIGAVLQGLMPAQTPDPATVAAEGTPREINNYACEAFRALDEQYRNMEHPSEEDRSNYVNICKEILSLLQTAVAKGPDEHLQNYLIYRNVDELVERAEDVSYWKRDEDGEWKEESFGVFESSFELPHQKKSWEKLAAEEKLFLDEIWNGDNPDRLAERDRLSAEAQTVREQLDALKAQKRELGIGANIPLLSNLINEDAREMNEKIKPVKKQLSALESQIGDIDDERDSWIDEQVDTLVPAFVKLDY